MLIKMRLDVPKCKRCFICVPLRYGIIIFGYLNLLFDLLLLGVDVVWMAKENGIEDLTVRTMVTYKGVSFPSQVWVLLLIYLIELIFNVVLLIGAHRKRVKLMTVYYYYGISTLFASIVTFLVVELRTYLSYTSLVAMSITFIGLLSHAYLLLLVRSEISKPRYNTNQGYENHLNHHHPPNWREPDVV